MIRRAGGHDRKYTVEEKCGVNRIGCFLVRFRAADWSHHYLGDGIRCAPCLWRPR